VGGATLHLWRAHEDRYEPAGGTQILLLGETHGEGYERELEVWKAQYGQGSRDLFIEMPFCTAQWLNLWMESESDEVLEQVYAELEGTAAHNEGYLAFLHEIKRECPETYLPWDRCREPVRDDWRALSCLRRGGIWSRL